MLAETARAIRPQTTAKAMAAVALANEIRKANAAPMRIKTANTRLEM